MVDPNPPEVTVSSDSSPDEMEAPLVGTDSKESKTSGDSNVSPNFNPRHTVGQGLHILSDTINDHLIAARYATLASIGLLAAYGLSHTPLFSRYRTVADGRHRQQ